MSASDVRRELEEAWREVVSKAYELIRSYPLCDSCLGRMFALLGRGYTNTERGRAIKMALVMGLHRQMREGSQEALQVFLEIAPNLGNVASHLYRETTGKELVVRPCFICGSNLEQIVETAARTAIKLIRSSTDARTFLVSALVSEAVREREDAIKRAFGLSYAESIGAEVRREVSKRIQKELGLRPEFRKPDVVVEVSVPAGKASLRFTHILIEGAYRKLARRISQALWLHRGRDDGPYFSVEEALQPLGVLLKGAEVVLHASGREDIDVRMLGTGRPMVVEVKEARIRYPELRNLEEAVNSYARGLVNVKLGNFVGRQEVRQLKTREARKYKTYKALVYVEGTVTDNDLQRLEEEFAGRSVRQRTPRRVRHRRPDIIRERVVVEVRTRRLGDNVFEALITAEGGLYIKELVSGDGGDTTPSFSEILGSNAHCVELDVLAVGVET